MQFHASAIGFVTFVAYLLIAGFFIRSLSAQLKDTPWGKALGFIY